MNNNQFDNLSTDKEHFETYLVSPPMQMQMITLTIPVPLSQTSGWISSPSAMFYYILSVMTLESDERTTKGFQLK